MSANTLVMTLVSEQTMPNIQFLKWFFMNNLQSVDMRFISTRKMEEDNKSEQIRNALEYLERWFSSFKVVIVDENDFDGIKAEIESLVAGKAYKRIVANITGGTKLMSLAMYEVCHERKESEIYYQSIRKDLQKIFPVREKDKTSVTLKEYMKGIGVKYKFDNETLKKYDFNKEVYENVIKDRRELIKKLVNMQNTPYFKNIFKRKDSIDISSMEEERLSGVDRDEFRKLIDDLGFDCKKLTHAQLCYITGGWFEEFVYQKIKAEKPLRSENIALNVETTKGDGKSAVKNELDVVYLDEENKLHVVECKSFLDVDGDKDSKVLNDALYKLQAIMKSGFGLNTASHLYTMSVIEKDSALNRAKEFGIEIVDGAALCKS